MTTGYVGWLFIKSFHLRPQQMFKVTLVCFRGSKVKYTLIIIFQKGNTLMFEYNNLFILIYLL